MNENVMSCESFLYSMEDNEEISFLDINRYKEIFGFTYDNNAKTTKSVKSLLLAKKGICFDFVNYLYFKNNKCGDCYFIHFNNKIHNTHTFYFINGYLIECTPPSNGYISKNTFFIKKMSLKDEIDNLVKQNVDMNNLDQPDDPPYDLVKYTPDNSEISIKDFISKRFNEGNLSFSTEEDKEKQHEKLDHNDKHHDDHEDIKEKNKKHLLDIDEMKKKEKNGLFEKLKELPGKASTLNKKARLWCRSRKNLFFYQKYLDRVRSGLYERYGDEAQVRENRMIDDPVTVLKGPAKQYIHDIVKDINKLYKEFNDMSEKLATKTTAEDCILVVQHWCKDYIGDKKDGGKRDDSKTSWKTKILESTKYKIARILLRYGKRSVYGYTSRNMVLKGYPTPNHLMVTMFVNNPEEHPEVQSVKNVFQSVDSFEILASSEKNDIFNIQNMSRSVLEKTCDNKVLNDIKEFRTSALNHFKAAAMDDKKENGKIMDEIWDGVKASGKEILSRKTYLIDCINVYFNMVLRIDNLAVMAIKDMLAVENKYRDKKYDRSLHVGHSSQVGNLSEREEREKDKYDGKSRKEFSNDLQKTAKMLNRM